MPKKDLKTMQDPLKQHDSKKFSKQKQPYPGLQSKMKPVAVNALKFK